MKLTTVILAGGQSKRMGKDKAFLMYKGKTFLRQILETTSKISSQIIIVANKDKRYYEKEIENIDNVELIKDINPYDGPLNAVATASKHIKEEFVFLSTCDIPIIDINIVEILLKEIDDKEAIIPIIDGKIQPFNTVYKKQAFEKAYTIYMNGNKSLMKWIRGINCKFIENFDRNMLMYKSINTPEDYKMLIEEIK